jgi:hypothetical protein
VKGKGKGGFRFPSVSWDCIRSRCTYTSKQLIVHSVVDRLLCSISSIVVEKKEKLLMQSIFSRAVLLEDHSSIITVTLTE